jgi:hypothetical protein
VDRQKAWGSECLCTRIKMSSDVINGELDDTAFLDFHRLVILFEWSERIPPNSPQTYSSYVISSRKRDSVSVFQAVLCRIIFLSITRVRVKNGPSVSGARANKVKYKVFQKSLSELSCHHYALKILLRDTQHREIWIKAYSNNYDSNDESFWTTTSRQEPVGR